MSGKSHSTEKAKANANRLGKHGRSETSLVPKSCGNCRIRKIRCDKNSPCSSCQIAKLPCGTTTVGRTESQSSATPETNPEKGDLSLIQESVLEIKKRLERLEQSQQTPKQSFEVCIVTAERNAASALSTTFQNEPSFQQQSAQASLSAEISAEETGNSDQEIQYSLASLKSLLQGHNLPSSVNDLYFPCSTPRAPLEDIELPPMSLVVAALKKATVKLPPVILHNGFRDHMMLENLCKKVYFPARPSSKGEVTLMNGLLFYLLDAYSQEDQADLSSSDCATYAKLCEKNFCDGIQDYECLVTPTLENIQCLMMGAMKAQGDARPSLCWTLVSTGARLCQSLGYHRESEVARGPPDLADAKRHVFWMLYMIDKIMSLNLGRASSFPDYDIDVEVFSPNPNPSFWAWDKVLMAFIELCKLQGQMYDELYSARARRQPPEMRSRLIQERSASLFAWHVNLKKIDTQHAQDQNDLNLLISWSDFFYYYILTLLYGAKTSQEAATHISSQRYKAASLGLQCHVQNYAKLSSTEVPNMKLYSGWILLFSSFAPFLVVFTHSLASHSQADIDLLRQVLRTLEAGRSISAATTRLHEVCSVFLRFATAFVLARQDCFGSYNREEDSFTFPVGLGEYLAVGTNTGTGTDVYDVASGFGGLEGVQGDLLPMSAFLGTCLGENINGLWNMDFS